MTGDELATRLEAGGLTLLDVRTPPEYSGEAGYPCDPRQGHIPGAVNVELTELQGADRDSIRRLLDARGADPDAPIVAYCHSGQRSAMAAAALRAAGFEAENYEGSWHEWSRRGSDPDAP